MPYVEITDGGGTGATGYADDRHHPLQPTTGR